MSFMEPYITMELTWWEVESNEGTHFLFNDLPLELDWSTLQSITRTTGYGARMSAPGYMDCTDWTVFNSEAEAAQHLLDMYFDMPDDEMTEDELADLRTLTTLANNNNKE